MKCLSCKKELNENVKFCTACGTPIKIQDTHSIINKSEILCPNCNNILKDGAKFCTKCGFNVVKTSNSSNVYKAQPEAANSMDNVKGMIFWNVQMGEIARRINEAEFIQYDSATGLIVNDGTTAYIQSEGVKIAELNGGVYNFIDPKVLEETLESRHGGGATILKKGWRGFVNMILGKKLKDVVTDQDEIHKQRSLKKVIECMRKDSLLSLTLKLNRDFELLFGSSHTSIDGYSDFTPMIIRTKYLDVHMGVRAMFKISDFAIFSQYYLADRKSVSTSYLVDMITPIIQAAIQEIMSDMEILESNLTEENRHKINNAIIIATSNKLYGVSLTQVAELSFTDDNLDRFRDLSRELYLSEKELDYLARTNSFKNRLNTQVDQQDIYDARRVYERDSILRSINKDEILSQNEFNTFLELLNLENRLKQAKSEEEVAVLNSEIEERGFARAHAFTMHQQHAISELEDLELERLRKARLSTTQIDIDEQRIRDDYQSEVINKVDERNYINNQRANKLKEMQADSALERLRKIKEIERLENDEAHKREVDKMDRINAHEINLGRSRSEHLDLMSNLSPEQLMAIAANENMSPDAAKEFARSFSEKYKGVSEKETYELISKLTHERINDKDKDADRMERMMQEMMITASNIASATQQNSMQIKDEYKERLERQEDRIDRTQDRALDYSTKNNAIKSNDLDSQAASCGAQLGEIYYHVDIEGKEELKLSFSNLTLMISKGLVQADTLVFSSALNGWCLAARLNEIKNLFL